MKNVIWLNDDMNNVLSTNIIEDEVAMILTHYDFDNSNYDEEILHTAVNNYINEYDEAPTRVIIIDNVPLNLHITKFNHKLLAEYMLNRLCQNDYISFSASVESVK